MRFLIDADLPRSVADVIRRHGHEAIDVRDIGLRTAKDAMIAQRAQDDGLCLITGDFDFADIRNYPPHLYAGLVVLSLPSTATAAYINQLVDQFLTQTEVVQQVPGQLAIVDLRRIRLRRSG
jgi:hypothetical protein